MHWINYFNYDFTKRKPTKWVWLSVLFYVLWVLLLFYFSHVWLSPTERGLNRSYYQQYYSEQSGYLCYLLIGCHTLVYAIEWMGKKDAYLEVMFGSSYLRFNLVQFWLNVMLQVIMYGIWVPIFYALSFQEIDILPNFWIQLSLNTCLFSGFMVIWIRVKSTYITLFGLVMLILHPNLSDLLPTIRWIDWVMPYNQGTFEWQPIWLALAYYWFAYHLYGIKPK